MRKQFIMAGLLAAGALAAAPALAQLGLGLGAKARVAVDPGQAVGGVVGAADGALGRTVNAADRAANRTLHKVGNARLALATRAEVRGGIAVRDSSGRRIGTVQSVHGDSAMIVQGKTRMHVPLASLYRGSSGLVTNLSRAQLRASANAGAHAGMNH